MKTEKTLFIAFSLLFINSLQGIAQSLPLLKSHSTLVSVRDGNDLKKGSWSIDPKIKPDIYNATVTGKYKWITFITDCDSLKFKVKTDKKYQFIIVLNEKDSAFTQINAIKPKTVNSNPNNAKFVTKDIHRFWKAYDKAYSDTIEFDLIFKKYYFDKGSLGMNDYVRLKIKSLSDFTSHIKSAPRFYQSIRGTTIRVDDYKKDFLKSFQALKGLYAPARFPDVYFVIGAFTSAGTVSDAGLLIGMNQYAQVDDTPLDELDFRLKTRLRRNRFLPNLIAHELIHFQQNGIKNDTITLGHAINEGMADFIAELISGGLPDPELYKWAKGKEKAIWNKFKVDMYFNRYKNWLANSQQATPDNFPDQGYWVGYQICKAYYENSKDKKKSIDEMFNIQDYRKFLEESGWEKKVNDMQ